ncbi:hypothetical protein [Janthinobacterium aquaticum]|uniref:hypothetical protein n=1 Tax=Janthinobacterium sp. FT58W TaxID=2654254 RepID=UPI001265A5D1|nr:hypothetical protein [Janthinobacterium sp. FT58W]KAB8041187.1 hypothetical protein GCM43_19280 [Janthinobacterium sp. FT58W]
MHMPIPFDTLDYAKKLSSAGVPVPQAEAHAAALGDVLDDVLGPAVVVQGELAAIERHMMSQFQLAEQKARQLAQQVEHGTATITDRLNNLAVMLSSKFDTLEQKTDARLERSEARHGADIRHLQWMMATVLLLNLGILTRMILH